MADHVNKQVRDAVIARLTGLTTTGARVHEYLVNPIDSITDLPALNIVTASDSAVSVVVHAPKVYERTVSVTISAYASGNSGLAGLLDLIRKEVELALGAAITIGAITLDVTYQDSETDITEGERQAGELKMQYNVVVMHTATAPDVLI
jgi:hypothetical protein